MIVEESYREIYKAMKNLNEKGLKITLKKNFQGVLFTKICNIDSLLSEDEKSHCIYHTQLHLDTLIKEIILKEGNREKIKLRNFFSRSHKKLWGEYQVY